MKLLGEVLLMAGATGGLVVYLITDDTAALMLCALLAGRLCFEGDES